MPPRESDAVSAADEEPDDEDSGLLQKFFPVSTVTDEMVFGSDDEPGPDDENDDESEGADA